MPHILKNNKIELIIDLPDEGYNFSRFDWSGKITEVKYRNIQLASIERTDRQDLHHYGRGFYNEFGIDTALGFEEAAVDGWFHKIGIGLLQKTDTEYLFSKTYKVKPAAFDYNTGLHKIEINCISEKSNGYAYELTKEIELLESGFCIKYKLHNTGERHIITDEYVHNFMAVNNELIGADYVLKFPFILRPESFVESVNPEGKVEINQDKIIFNGTPTKDFFFSNLSGGESVEAAWKLTNLSNNITLSEKASFRSDKINLWGWTHVISPELFYQISIKPGESTEWSRYYEIIE